MMNRNREIHSSFPSKRKKRNFLAILLRNIRKTKGAYGATSSELTFEALLPENLIHTTKKIKIKYSGEHYYYPSQNAWAPAVKN